MCNYLTLHQILAGLVVGFCIFTNSFGQAKVLQEALVLRQTGPPATKDVPPQCKLDCDSVNSVLQTGTCPPQQCCTAGFERSYFDCFRCVNVVTGATDSALAGPQQVIDSLWSKCSSLGYSLPLLTYPGQDPNRAVPTVQPIENVSSTSSSQGTMSRNSPLTPTGTSLTPDATPSTSTTPSASVLAGSAAKSLTPRIFDTIIKVFFLGFWLRLIA